MAIGPERTDRDETIEIERTGDEHEAGRKGGAVVGTFPGTAARAYAAPTDTEVGEAVYLGISRASWPAIWAGFFIGTMTYIVLNVLGIALGISWMNVDQVQPGALQTAGLVWMIAATLISFFVGGYVAGRMSSLPGQGTGAMNGLLYGCFSMLFLFALSMVPALAGLSTVTALMTRMGAGGINAGIPNAVVPNVTAAEVMPPTNPSDMVTAIAWWSFAALVIALGAATFGGMCGARKAPVDPLATGEDTHRFDRR